MMIENVLSRSLRIMFAGGLAIGMHGAYAQTVSNDGQASVDADAASGEVQRVEVTGSSIKRLSSQTALPITTIKASDFAKQGLTTAAEVLNTIPGNQSSEGSSQSVGSGTGGISVADLRGLGSDKTLVLLNGRRIASHPYGGASVDLNMIPLSALDRVEVLRDGASAIYGTDAIGGVINFITKRSVQGATVSVEQTKPQASGGGAESRLNLSGGYGDLNKDGFNIFGVIDLHKQNALAATDRDFSSHSVPQASGLQGNSATSQPANFFSANSITGNPYYASGCQGAGLYVDNTHQTCRTDTVSYIQDIPKTKQESFLGKATFKLSEDNVATVEYLHTRSTNDNSIAPSPDTGLTMTSASQYYPGGSAGVPAVAGLNGSDLSINWRTVAAGNREDYDTSTSDRLVLASEGLVAGWDYNVGLTYSVSKATSAFTGGYTNDSMIAAGVLDGTLNPFGAQSAAGQAYLDSATLRGEYLNAKMTSTGVDGKISREIYQLPAGAVGFAVGTEFRHDKAEYDVNTALASQAASSGYGDAQDQAGQRSIAALYSELSVPLAKHWDLSLAARYDHYNDVGGSFNPKIGLRWQPVEQLLVRGSYNTGFRAPTLYDLHAPETSTFTGNAYNDPTLCPDGKTPLHGANPNLACAQQQLIRSGGNEALNPEKSKTFSFGVVFEPVKAVTVSFDYFNIKIRDKIGTVSEETIFANPAKYASDFVYSADGTTLQYVNAELTNLGEVHTSGIDTSLNWKLPHSNAGDFAFQLDGTWVHKYEYQNEIGGAYTENVGVYADNGPVFRWKHNATLGWALGQWNASFSNKFMTGYQDQNADGSDHHVRAYSTYSLSAGYVGIKNTDLTVGIKNLFDSAPPYTNQGTIFQQGYDARYTDPLGRTLYVKATYKF